MNKLLRRLARCSLLRSAALGGSSVTVPEGYLPFYVGEEMERFVVSADLLNHPLFINLLNKSAQEYGYQQKGVLRIACHVILFRRLLQALQEGEEASSCEHDLRRLLIWKHVIQKGDAVVDATCGNGHDTLALVNMVADELCSGHVYSMDIQESALQNTACLLDKSLDPHKRGMVELFANCHSKMEEVVPNGVTVRLVAFNLGYLPGGDKTVITKSETTLLGMKAASRILASGGLISMLVYVGHPGGMEEYEMVEGFASGLQVNEWICCKLQMMNRPLAPILVLLCKR
ncbi:hypothetical protein SSX86_000488 [Deinandra increscens subsp. villosa]|uniref:Uncharacterized protein n=1 Tax=Deinandra increscens subsp. villosa TaxID=3103831 RepID=A0AAP0HFA7_9ASTR